MPTGGNETRQSGEKTDGAGGYGFRARRCATPRNDGHPRARASRCGGPAASGTGSSSAWDAFMSASRAVYLAGGGNAAVFFAVISTCSDRFSDVCRQPSPSSA